MTTTEIRVRISRSGALAALVALELSERSPGPPEAMLHRRAYCRRAGSSNLVHAASFGESRTPAPPLLLTVTEVCSLLQVSRWSVYELIRTKKLNTIRIGRRRLIPTSAVRVMLDRLSNEERA
jgi:excisionase family DNA binding protein